MLPPCNDIATYCLYLVFERLLHCVFNMLSWLMDLLTSLFLSFQSNVTVPFVHVHVSVLKTLLTPRVVISSVKGTASQIFQAVGHRGDEEGRLGCGVRCRRKV
jgi:hypothetical protein